MIAHNLCSAVFISNLDPQATAEELVKPMLPGFVGRLLRFHVDRAHKIVDASVAGLKPLSAAFTPGYGCRLVRDPRYQQPPAVNPPSASPIDSFAPPTPVVTEDLSIKTALDREFTEQPSRRSR